MFNPSIVICIVLLFSIPSTITSTPCTESDYQQYFSECDPKTNTRNVTIYLTKECENVQITDPSNPLSVYSTLPTITIQCGLKCPAGEIMRLDPIKKEAVCQKCPEDTYSVGGDFKVNNKWTQDNLKKFDINCYAIGISGYKKNEDCTGILISPDKTMIMSGDITGNQVKYFVQVMYFFKAKNAGRVILQYKKDSVKEISYNNGDFKFFFDYDYVTGDSEPDTPWRTIYHDFQPGEHEIVLFYWYLKTTKQPLRFYIKSFEIIGIDDAAYKCEKCVNSVAPEGSDHCYSCQSNFYYDQQEEDCVKCPDTQFSIPNSFGGNSCMAKKICSDYEYEVTSISKCVDKKKNITYNALQPCYCLDEKNINRTETVSCEKEEDEEENKCGQGMFKISSFKYDFKTIMINEFFKENSGWKCNGKEIYSGIYINESVEKILSKSFNITSQNAYMEIKIEMNLDQSEILKIKTNKETTVFSNVKKTITQHYDLDIGENTLTFIYEKNSNVLKIENGVSISTINIFGSDLSSEVKYQKCPIGTIGLKDCTKCVECKPNEIPDKNQTYCIKCQNGIHQIINNESVCVDCPPYTFLDSTKCRLNDVVYNDEAKLKFNLAPMKDWLDKLCSAQSGILCYENSFIGPISNITVQDEGQSSTSHDLFFISLFEPKTVNIYDFSYDEEANKYKQGHIFGLFSVNNPVSEQENNNTDVFMDHNITFQNVKIKKNIAAQINKIQLVPKTIDSNKRLGIVIDYTEGDICLSDPSKRYKTYLYLKCNKYEISTPRLVKVKDNGCTYIFEWNSPYICKNCITSELSNFERGACKNNRRQVIFTSNDDCLIFNASNPELIGYDKSYPGNLLTDNNMLSMLTKFSLRNNDVVIVKEGESVTFPFEYIESKIYHEPCTFVDNIDKNWKKYLLIIPILYLITLVLVICYCCKYRRIKSEYEKLRSTDTTHSETNIGKESRDLHLEPEKQTNPEHE